MSINYQTSEGQRLEALFESDAERILEKIMHRRNWTCATRDALAKELAEIVRREVFGAPRRGNASAG